MNHEWLTQVIVYTLYRWFGFSGILLFTGLVSTATLALFYVLLCRVAQSAWLAFVTTFASVLAFRGFQPDRPLWFSYLLLMVVLLAIETSRSAAKPSKLFYGLPLVISLWANLHSGVVLGLSVLGAHWFVAEVSRFSHPLYSVPQLRRLRLVIGAAAIASLLNPYGYHIYALVFTHLTSPLPRMTIAEWLPPELGALYFKVVLGGTLWLLIAVLGLSQRRVEADRLIWLLGAAALALTSRRHLPLLVFFGAITIALHVAALVTELRGLHIMRKCAARIRSFKLAQLAQGFLSEGKHNASFFSVALVVLSISFSVHQFRAFVRTPFVVSKEYPGKALAFIESKRLTHRVCASYNWGGYIIWRSWPRVKVFVDGRSWTVYPAAFMEDALMVDSAWQGWQKVLDKYKVNVVLIPQYAHLVVHLAQEKGWKRIYRDQTAVVFQRVSTKPQRPVKPPNRARTEDGSRKER